MIQPSFRDLLAKRFEKKVSPEPNSGCWIWTGHDDAGGFPSMSLPNNNKHHVRASHVSLQLAGVTVPKGANILHRCGLLPCVNPDHLFFRPTREQTAQENKRRVEQRKQQRRMRCCAVCGEVLPDTQRSSHPLTKYCPECKKKVLRIQRADKFQRDWHRNPDRFRKPKQVLQCPDCAAMFMGFPKDKRCAGCKYLCPEAARSRRAKRPYCANCLDCGAPIIVRNRTYVPLKSRCDECQTKRKRMLNILCAEKHRKERNQDPIRYGEYLQHVTEMARQRRAVLKKLLANPDAVLSYIMKGN